MVSGCNDLCLFNGDDRVAVWAPSRVTPLFRPVAWDDEKGRGEGRIKGEGAVAFVGEGYGWWWGGGACLHGEIFCLCTLAFNLLSPLLTLTSTFTAALSPLAPTSTSIPISS